MKKDITIFLQHMIDCIEKVEEYTETLSEEKFLRSTQSQDAVLRRLEIMGEAAKNIPDEFKRNHPTIPWGEIVRTRDKLIHGYFGVDLKITWNIIKQDLPGLKEKIIAIRREME